MYCPNIKLKKDIIQREILGSGDYLVIYRHHAINKCKWFHFFFEGLKFDVVEETLYKFDAIHPDE